MSESNKMEWGDDLFVETVYLIKFSSEDGNELFICGGDTEKIAIIINENLSIDFVSKNKNVNPDFSWEKSIHEIDLYLDENFDTDSETVYPVYEINESGEKEFIILCESEDMIEDFCKNEGFMKDKKSKLFINNNITRVYDEIKLWRE